MWVVRDTVGGVVFVDYERAYVHDKKRNSKQHRSDAHPLGVGVRLAKARI